MSERPYNRFLGGLRLILLFAFIVALLMLARPTPVSVVLGVPFILAGEAVRFWAAGHLYKTVELITSGPYRYTRNPLYLGRLLIFTGFALMAVLPYRLHLAVLFGGYLIFFGYYLPRKERVEPARLLETHGEPFERYFNAVPALFPRWTPYPEARQQPWRLERMLRNREQWMVVGLGLVVAFMLWRALTLPA